MGVEFEYQKALFAVIDTAKVSLGIVGTYDTAPQAADGGNPAAFPYIVMGENFATQLDTQTKNGFTFNTRIHTYSRTGSMKECKNIQSGIYELLHRQPLTVTGFHAFELLRSDTECIALQDGVIHGVCEYVGLVEFTS
jgi:hypothetical protein